MVFLEIRSLIEHGTHLFRLGHHQANRIILRLFLPSAGMTGINTLPCLPFHVTQGNPNSDPHACTVNILLNQFSTNVKANGCRVKWPKITKMLILYYCSSEVKTRFFKANYRCQQSLASWHYPLEDVFPSFCSSWRLAAARLLCSLSHAPASQQATCCLPHSAFANTVFPSCVVSTSVFPIYKLLWCHVGLCMSARIASTINYHLLVR